MKKVRVGVLGACRGRSMIDYCKMAENVDLVAVCDKAPYELDRVRREADGLPITYYDNFEDFLRHDMDAVVLANYATEHAPFAVRCLESGRHVFSEVLPSFNLKQSVELIEAVEKSGLIYAYGENYCYMAAPMEMRKLYRENVIGELEYAEGEYVHNCEPIWARCTYGEKDHWRNNTFSSYYCTHSFGPIVHITGLRPVSVIGIESVHNERRLRNGCKCATWALELVRMENGAVVKSLHGDLYKDNIWYTLYGSKGRLESSRYAAKQDKFDRIYKEEDAFSGEYPAEPRWETYLPEERADEKVKSFGHGGSDFWSMYYFIEKIRGDQSADVIDVYEALNMSLPGLFAYRSILADSKEMKVPDLRNKSERDEWRNDTACTIPSAAGDMLLPTQKSGTPDIPDEVYDAVRQKWEKILAEREGKA